MGEGRKRPPCNPGSSWDLALTSGALWPRSRQGGQWVESYKEETLEVKGNFWLTQLSRALANTGQCR